MAGMTCYGQLDGLTIYALYLTPHYLNNFDPEERSKDLPGAIVCNT